MENKEVEHMLDSIKCEYALLEGKLHYQSKDVEKLLQDKQTLEKRTFELERCIKRLQGGKQNREARIRNLEKKLQAKDKALDKACGKIEYETQDNCDCPNVAYGFVPKCCGEDFCEGSNKECWKEWCENGID